jgi:hypothetical protein
MDVTYELLDVAYPFVSAIYGCRCGERAVRFADEAGSPPDDWHVEQGGDAATRYVCPECVRRRDASARQPR